MDSLPFLINFMQLDVALIFAGVVVFIVGKAAYNSFHIKRHNACKSVTTALQKDLKLIPPLEVEEVDMSHAVPRMEPDAEPSVAEEGISKSSVPTFRWKWPKVVLAILALACLAVYWLQSQPDVIDTFFNVSSLPVPETIQVFKKQKLVDLVWEQRSQHDTIGVLPINLSTQSDPVTIQSVEKQIGTVPASEQRIEILPGTGDHNSPALGAIGRLTDHIAASALSEINPSSEDAEDPWGEDDSDCFGGEPALIIKLTRQIVEINHKTNYVKSDYHGTILVGTPGLPMTVVFDTGSGHLLLPSMYCKTEACKVHTRYRRSGSSTGRDINFNGSAVVRGLPRDSITVEFGTGEATGVVVALQGCRMFQDFKQHKIGDSSWC
jgi:hypothetical protein